MQRIFLFLFFSLSCTFTVFAGTNYQVDMILFAQPQTGDSQAEQGINSPFIPMNKNTMTLKNNTHSTKNFSLLSPSKSSLKDQYYLLNRTHQYQILGHYSWIQPANNQNKIALPKVSHNGWKMQGTVRVRKSTYYLFDGELQLSSPRNPQLSYMIEQNQRLKENVVYYLDNPQLGILLRVHRVA
ncbi:MAG: hypothetical protein EPN84_06485 [Legionella sp.]|nr:MAG: hypothetical protein EPN84_06485 [Legionella sp.]